MEISYLRRNNYEDLLAKNGNTTNVREDNDSATKTTIKGRVPVEDDLPSARKPIPLVSGQDDFHGGEVVEGNTFWSKGNA